MKIIEIREVNTYKCKLFFEEEDPIVLYKKDLKRYNLKEGTVLADKQKDVLLMEILPYRAKARCLKLLQARDYTEAEIGRKLKEDGYPGAVIQNTIEYLKQYQYVDDIRYTRLFFDSKKNKKSKNAILMDLQRKGVSKESIMLAFSEMQECDSEYINDKNCINNLLYKKRYNDLDASYGEKEKMKAYLFRKGFEIEEINACMKHFNWEKM